MDPVFISELLGGEIFPIILQFPAKNAEICDEWYLKFKISPTNLLIAPILLS